MLRSNMLILPALALMVVLAGCSSSKNNSNNSPFNQIAATQAAPVAATTIAAPPAASATRAAGAASSTNTSNISVTQISTSVSSSSTDACATSVSGAPGQTDANLQSQLAKVALTEKDLPSGYSSLTGLLGGGESDLTYPNETASYSDFFIKGSLTNRSSGNPLAGDIFIESLNGFKDSGAASSTLKDLRAQALKQACSPDTKIEPASGAPKLGDETLAYKISSTGDETYAGYLIVWRRGKVDVVVGMIGTPGPKSLDDTAALAQKLDAKMKAGGL